MVRRDNGYLVADDVGKRALYSVCRLKFSASTHAQPALPTSTKLNLRSREPLGEIELGLGGRSADRLAYARRAESS
jgi:hypothetical protein